MQINNFAKWWLIGDFTPSLLKTREFEAGIKFYQKGEKDAPHYHKIATEYTIIHSGKFRKNSDFYSAGDIMIIYPDEISDFECIDSWSLTVIKVPSVAWDKYLV